MPEELNVDGQWVCSHRLVICNKDTQKVYTVLTIYMSWRNGLIYREFIVKYIVVNSFYDVFRLKFVWSTK